MAPLTSSNLTVMDKPRTIQAASYLVYMLGETLLVDWVLSGFRVPCTQGYITANHIMGNNSFCVP